VKGALKMTKRILLFISALFVFPAFIYASATDYLILQDIGPYKIFTTVFPEDFTGPPPKYSQTNTGGVLDAASHFSENDVSYEASYTEPGGKWPFVKVEVTQHAGSDSDRWLLHEVEKSFRTYYGIPGDPYAMRVIDGNTIMTFGSSGWTYRWLGGNKVIQIEYDDSMMEKPEPLEVIQSYLQKFPSTFPATLILDKSHDEQWIKDEMDRRLWLCDKWFEQLQLGKADQSQVLQEAVKSMNIFLDYREKYYGMKAADDKIALSDYLYKNDITSIKNKLSEYKDWWTANKSGSLIGLLTTCPHRLCNNVSHFFKRLLAFLASLPGRLTAVFG
jgi:hypothetical protein